MLIVVCQLLVVSCSKKADPADVAARAAKQYYDYLLEGKPEAFVDGQWRPGGIPEDYRQGLITSVGQFLTQQQHKHRGIKETRIANAVVDDESHEANVFLVFCYGDSTSEEVCVPMLEDEGIWYLR